MNITKYITIGGRGTRLSSLSLLDKQYLYYQDKKIIEHILNIFPDAKIVGKNKTQSRIETLRLIEEKSNILIIDCDIIPYNINLENIDINVNNIYAFKSNKNKYGSILINDNIVIDTNEKINISNIKCSGVYFCKDLDSVISQMTDSNSIASGMLGSRVIIEDTFKRFGDIEDYYDAIGLTL